MMILREIGKNPGCNHWLLRKISRKMQQFLLRMLVIRDEGIEIKIVIRSQNIIIL